MTHAPEFSATPDVTPQPRRRANRNRALAVPAARAIRAARGIVPDDGDDSFEDLLRHAAQANEAPRLEALPQKTMRIAMVGTRGVPAAYGGFETAIEEIGQRLVARGHEVTVYCRVGKNGEKPATHLGMKLVYLPAMKRKTLETLSHTALSAMHMMATKGHDAAFVFNAANAPFVPMIKARRTPVAVHVDGLEWKRGKWGKWGKRYYRMAEEFAVRTGDALISDAKGIADYYDQEFGVPTELLTYGANRLTDVPTDKLAKHGLEAGKFHVAVARFEPENHVDVIVEGYAASTAEYPLVVVGSAPYAEEYTDRIAAMALADPRIKMLGGVWDQDELNQLYAHARTYIHGHSVGGTNPSLLRAMGAGTAVIAYDVNFNREVAGHEGMYFSTAKELAPHLHEIETDAWRYLAVGQSMQDRAVRLYNWDDVTLGYEALALKLASGASIHGMSKGRRRKAGWESTADALLPTDARVAAVG